MLDGEAVVAAGEAVVVAGFDGVVVDVAVGSGDGVGVGTVVVELGGCAGSGAGWFD